MRNGGIHCSGAAMSRTRFFNNIVKIVDILRQIVFFMGINTKNKINN